MSRLIYCYAECLYAKCRCDECRGAVLEAVHEICDEILKMKVTIVIFKVQKLVTNVYEKSVLNVANAYSGAYFIKPGHSLILPMSIHGKTLANMTKTWPMCSNLGLAISM